MVSVIEVTLAAGLVGDRIPDESVLMLASGEDKHTPRCNIRQDSRRTLQVPALFRLQGFRSELGCFQSSEGFSQVAPGYGVSPRLILLPFGGIPNSPAYL